MKASFVVSLALALATASSAHAQNPSEAPYVARAFNPANADLPRSTGMPAQLANEEYVEALARIVYYWAYPAIDVTSRTTRWELMREGPGLMFGIGPGSPVNESGCLSGYGCEAISRNHVLPPGVTAEMIAADPDAARPQWVVPSRFWQDLERVLAFNPRVRTCSAQNKPALV